MEYPYIGVLWTPANTSQAHVAAAVTTKLQRDTHWQPALLRHGITIFTREPHVAFLDAYPLAGKTGVVLGTLFRQDNDSRLSPQAVAEDINFADACLRSRGEHLTKTCWGTYVALLSHPQTGDWSIARDCSGMIPCYYTTARGVTIAFSDIRDLDLLSDIRDQNGPLLRFEVNWRYIIGFLASTQMQIRDTGLKGVHELLAGESLESTSGPQNVRALWNPIPIAEHDSSIQIDIGDACRVLRETAQSCIRAWAGTGHRILHSLSGGFDSSLVLSLLKAAPGPPKVLCVNRFASGPGEDERGYSRTAAQWAQVDLLELPWDNKALALDDNCLRLPRTAKPALPHLFNGMDAAIYNQIGATYGYDTIWTGQGGDHLFMSWGSDLGPTDCLQHHGLMSSRMVTTLAETSRLTRKSLIHLTRLTIRRNIHVFAHKILSDDPFFAWVNLLPDTRFLTQSLLPPDLVVYIQHPWAARSAVVSPGKRHQLLLLAEVLNRHRPLYGLQGVQEFHPLLSQPLIEACLRIPIYLLLTGGKNRGLARLAFKDCLPPKILSRQGKGQTTHFTLRLLQRNLPFLTELLFDGALLRQGIVDRDTLEPVLRPDAPIDGFTTSSLFACLAAEIWLQGWMSKTTGTRRTGSRHRTTIP